MSTPPAPFDTSSASASVSPCTSDGYDVFINCCLVDVGKTWGSHLYHCLLAQGLRILLGDTGELREDIPEGDIKTASVHLAILSPRYAASVRCLNELVLMLDSRSTIIPVFYNVSPGELRSMRGIYGEKMYSLDTITKWRKALFEVTEINGFSLYDYNGDEGRLVNNIVEGVLKKLRNHLSYNVFINHRGDDVKKNLASHLYYGLVAHGLRVFLDIEEMRQGDGLNYQIERAIETAFVHIAIFSPKYAESEWCLNELVDMFKSGKTIIPVFKGVRPSELGLENGRYAKDLCKLKEKKTVDPQTKRVKPRFDNDTLENWRFCLSRVAQVADKRGSDLEEWDRGEGKVIRGFDLEECDGDEGQLVDQVVKRVLEEEAERATCRSSGETGIRRRGEKISISRPSLAVVLEDVKVGPHVVLTRWTTCRSYSL